MITRQEAIDLFKSDDLIGLGMAADSVRRKLHPQGVVSYIIDRNINYTNFCTEYCSFCAFYRPPGHAEGYILSNEVIYQKIQETLDLGGTGVLMQGGLHPDFKIEWYEDMMRGIKQRFPKVHLHCYSASEIIAIAEYSSLTIRDTIIRLRDARTFAVGATAIASEHQLVLVAREKVLGEFRIARHRVVAGVLR